MREYPVKLQNHEGIVKKYESQPIVKGGILLYGSSFFTNWQNAAAEVAEASGSVNYAVLNLLDFGAMIAINLAVMNLLPFPALDGGRVLGLVLTTAVEGITRKKIDPKYEGYIHAAGMIILLAFMGFIMLKDIWGLF